MVSGVNEHPEWMAAVGRMRELGVRRLHIEGIEIELFERAPAPPESEIAIEDEPTETRDEQWDASGLKPPNLRELRKKP
jgi:hypothetical protein